jgi:PAS domain S-box-containing protein
MDDGPTFSRLIVDSIPGLVALLSPDGDVQFVNRQILEYTGRTLEELKQWGANDIVHPEDLPHVARVFAQSIASGIPYEIALRLRQSDGVYQWFQNQGFPVRDADGHIAQWCVLLANIDDLKRMEEALMERERESQMIVDTIPGLVGVSSPSGELEIQNQRLLEYFGKSTEDLRHWKVSDVIHPEDLPRAIRLLGQALASEQPLENEARLRRFDGVYRWFTLRGCAARDKTGRVARWYYLMTDVDDLKRAEVALRDSEQSLRLIVDGIPGLVVIITVTGEVQLVNRQALNYFGKTVEQLTGSWLTSDAVHPDDLPGVRSAWEHSAETAVPYDVDLRLRRVDGVFRWFRARGLPLREAEGRIVRWCVLLTDVDERKQEEEKLKRSEWLLNEAQSLGHSGSWSLDVLSGTVTTSSEMFRAFGVSPGEDCSSPEFWFNRIHPEDRKWVRDLFESCVFGKTDYEAEYRLLLPDGSVKYQHSIGRPIMSDAGDLLEFVGTAIDVTEQKLAKAELEKALSENEILKDQLYKENLVLRDEVDRVSMFEEIVGTSSALEPVLKRIARVAPTDSTVLITGETGTGKELVARAIHRRSERANRSFVSVSCAAIPGELVASELFGHEKGAFTGATQRRLGRFELAHGGTIFLDEVGELPMATQVALLRILQERTLERVGGSTSVHVDVRVIAATNRDLRAAIEAGTFRSDLFYRLNVFPIQVPALRERSDDIPVLVEYFIERYARKSGKTIRLLNKRTLDQLRSYPWPGNVRELQNVIERSVILCDTGEFRVDESWISTRPAIEGPSALSSSVAAHEKAVIEDALRASGGRVFGSSGAAARLGIPRSTLDSKIRALKINKNSFRPRSAKP